MSFIGREAELRFLRDRLAEASAGSAQTVLLEGPAGMGKTALLSAFSGSLGHCSRFTASGDEAETFLDFGVLLQLLRLRAPRWSDPLSAGADLLGVLDELPPTEASVFLVDDVHLADNASLTAMTFALRRLQEDPVMAVVVAREDEVDRLPPGLLRLVDAQENRVRLGGLTPGEVAELARACIGEPLPRGAAARLRDHTGGRPLYLTALMGELSVADLRAAGPLPAPHSHASVVIRSLSGRSVDAQSLARAAAVLPDGSPLDLVARVAETRLSPGSAKPLEELTQAGILTCEYDDVGWRVRFTHPLVRAAVHDDLGPDERVGLHGRAAGLLHGEQRLLHRVAATSGPDRELAHEVARQAQARKDDGHPHRAAEMFLMASRLAGPAHESADRVMEAASLFLIAGDVTSAKQVDGLLTSLPAGGRRFYLQAKIAWFSGQPAEAEALATRAWDRADDLDRRGRGALAGLLAQLCNLRGAGAQAAAWAERALAEELVDDLADSTAAARALGLALAGRTREAFGLLDALDADPVAVAPAQPHQLTTRGALRAVLDDLDGATRDLDVVCTSAGDAVSPYRLLAMGVLADVEYRAGHWARSLTLAEHAVSLAEDSEQRWLLGYLETSAVLVLAGSGLWEQAESRLARAREIAVELGDPATLAVCENAGVHLAWCRADHAAVASRSWLLLSLGSGPTHEPGLLGWPVQYVAALVELGRHDEAERTLAEFTAVARERGSRSRLAALARVRGELHTARREHGAARLAFEEALKVGEGAGDALERAVVRASYGRFLRRRGERRAAADRLQDARNRFVSLGATPFVERCDEELAACGVSALDGTGSPVEPLAHRLTPQERLVAGLACEGLSNQEIARRLVLSGKTIGYHLGNVYAKLDVHSRAQLITQLGTGSVGT